MLVLGLYVCRFVGYGLYFLLGLVFIAIVWCVNSVGIVRYMFVVWIGCVLVALLLGFAVCLYLIVMLIAFSGAWVC